MTQYSRIAALMKARGYVSYNDLMRHCRVNYPWKRIGEMEARGWRFVKQTKPHNGRQIVMVALIGSP